MSAALHPEPATRIAVPRRWIGAPDGLWNPTLSLMALVVATWSLCAFGFATGRLSAWLAVPGLALAYYWVFTVLHESMHGIAHRSRLVNAALGRIAGFALMLPWPLFRAAHLSHHAHTNDLRLDPDLMVAHRPRWLAPFWFAITPIEYRKLVYGKGMLRTPGARTEAWVSEAMILGTIAVAALTGRFELVAWVWLLPALLAILWLALAFDLLPHHPHTSQDRYYDTRIYPGRILNALLLGQNYHLIHHLWTTIPWYRYAQAYADVEADLRERGAPIGWNSRAEPPRPS